MPTDPCFSANAPYGQHALSFDRSANGCDEYVCTNCGDTVIQYVDGCGR